MWLSPVHFVLNVATFSHIKVRQPRGGGGAGVTLFRLIYIFSRLIIHPSDDISADVGFENAKFIMAAMKSLSYHIFLNIWDRDWIFFTKSYFGTEECNKKLHSTLLSCKLKMAAMKSLMLPFRPQYLR